MNAETIPARVVIGGPEGLHTRLLGALVGAFRDRDAIADGARTDLHFSFGHFEHLCQSQRRTHLLLAINGAESLHEANMLRVAQHAGVRKVILICLGGCDALARHQKLAESGRLKAVVVGSVEEESEAKRILGNTPSVLIAPNLTEATSDIAVAVLES